MAFPELELKLPQFLPTPGYDCHGKLVLSPYMHYDVTGRLQVITQHLVIDGALLHLCSMHSRDKGVQTGAIEYEGEGSIDRIIRGDVHAWLRVHNVCIAEKSRQGILPVEVLLQESYLDILKYFGDDVLRAHHIVGSTEYLLSRRIGPARLLDMQKMLSAVEDDSLFDSLCDAVATSVADLLDQGAIYSFMPHEFKYVKEFFESAGSEAELSNFSEHPHVKGYSVPGLENFLFSLNQNLEVQDGLRTSFLGTYMRCLGIAESGQDFGELSIPVDCYGLFFQGLAYGVILRHCGERSHTKITSDDAGKIVYLEYLGHLPASMLPEKMRGDRLPRRPISWTVANMDDDDQLHHMVAKLQNSASYCLRWISSDWIYTYELEDKKFPLIFSLSKGRLDKNAFIDFP
jgi:hypothetical protein